MRLSELRAGGDPEKAGRVKLRSWRMEWKITLDFYFETVGKTERLSTWDRNKIVLCSCPSIGKHSAQTGDLTPLPPGCLPERRMVFPWTEISNTHCHSTLHTGVRGHYGKEVPYCLFQAQFGKLQMKATLLVLMKLMKIGGGGMDEKAAGREDLCPWHKF